MPMENFILEINCGICGTPVMTNTIDRDYYCLDGCPMEKIEEIQKEMEVHHRHLQWIKEHGNNTITNTKDNNNGNMELLHNNSITQDTPGGGQSESRKSRKSQLGIPQEVEPVFNSIGLELVNNGLRLASKVSLADNQNCCVSTDVSELELAVTVNNKSEIPTKVKVYTDSTGMIRKAVF